MADYVDFTRTQFGHAKLFANLFEERLFTDAIIATSSQPNLLIHCHRVILAAVSTPLKNRFLQVPDTRETVFVGNMDYNILYDILKLIYTGQVRIRSSQQEDFMAAMRSLYIKLGDKIDKMVYHDQAHSSSANNFPFLKGVVQVAPKLEPEAVNDAQENVFQQSFQQSNPIQQSNVIQQNRQQHYPSKITSGFATASGTSGSKGPFASVSSNCSGEEAMPFRTSGIFQPQASTIGGGFREGYLPPSRSSIQISVNPNSGERAIMSANGTATKRPAFQDNQANSSWPKRHRDNSPQPGPQGLFWLRLQHQVQTTAHAVWDKYGTYGLKFAGGSYYVGEELFLAFATKQGAQEAIDVVGSAEPETLIKSVGSVPAMILQELLTEHGNQPSGQNDLSFQDELNKARAFGVAMNSNRANKVPGKPVSQAHMSQAPSRPNIFNRGAARNDFPSTQISHSSTVFKSVSSLPQKNETQKTNNIVGRLLLKNFPLKYNRSDYIRLLKTSYIKNYVSQTIHVNPGTCTLEFFDAKELQDARKHLDGQVISGSKVSAAITK